LNAEKRKKMIEALWVSRKKRTPPQEQKRSELPQEKRQRKGFGTAALRRDRNL